MIPLASWEYYREKYHTVQGCIESQFPQLLGDPDILAAVAAIRNAERAIEARVRELDNSEDDD